MNRLMLTRYGLSLSDIDNLSIEETEAYLEAANYLFAIESVRSTECIAVALGDAKQTKSIIERWFKKIFESASTKKTGSVGNKQKLSFKDMMIIASGRSNIQKP